jgi:hypothetical protein
MSDTLQERLRKRADIRRNIPRGEPDRIADLCEEAASRIDHLEMVYSVARATITDMCNEKRELERDADRFAFVLPILTAQGNLGDQRAYAIGLALMRGLDGRAAVDAAVAKCQGTPPDNAEAK